NVGADVGEFVEVVVESPETVCIWDLTLYMYNGADGKPYCLDCISEFTPGDRVGPYQFYTWFRSGIQNDMEGMILVYFDSLVHIIAYEGSFYGTLDPANGLLFPDVGVRETSSSPITASIYLTGFPGDPWAYGEQSTPGSPNPGQVLTDMPLPVRLGRFSARKDEDAVLLEWRSESEHECAAYRLYRNGEIKNEIPSKGTVSSAETYSYRDTDILSETNYCYILAEIRYDGSVIHLDSLEIRTTEDAAKSFQILSPFPNPLNPSGKIPLQIFDRAEFIVDIIDLNGKRIKEIHKGMLDAGICQFDIHLPDQPSGTYFLRCQSGTYSDCKPFVLMK
ncbi:MAG: T9SS type A sorting domain-containing protein, partial [FCB group bacterium]|nr:T9SS type A sorting domain-containing protein [FCB group bacterium]